MTAETLNGYSSKALAEMAKNRGVRGWHSMRKDQLVKELLKIVRQKANKTKAQAARSSTASPSRSNSSVRSTTPLRVNGPTKAAATKTVVSKPVVMKSSI